MVDDDGKDRALDGLLREWGHHGSGSAPAFLQQVHRALLVERRREGMRRKRTIARWTRLAAAAVIVLAVAAATVQLLSRTDPLPRSHPGPEPESEPAPIVTLADPADADPTAPKALPLADSEPPVRSAHPLGSTAAPYGYLAWVPSTSAAQPAGRFPLVIFLHGVGEKGDGSSDQLPRLLKHGPPRLLEADDDRYPGTRVVTIAPQSINGWWTGSNLVSFIDHLINTWPIDPERVIVTGLSSGGSGCWELARASSRRISAMLPIASATSPPAVDPTLGDIAIWSAHHQRDPHVPFAHTRRWMEALARARHGAAELSLHHLLPQRLAAERTLAWIPGRGWEPVPAGTAPAARLACTIGAQKSHQIWQRMYEDPAVWEWLLGW